jgi:hypothetical protein
MPVKLGGGSGATNPPLIPDVLLTVSTTWSPPYKVKALVRCFGGGGSGSVGCMNASYTYPTGALGGGGAGEHAGSILELDPAVTYTVVVGVGGVKKSRSSDGVATGNAGGNTSFAGSGVTTITANGGAGGGSGAGGASTVINLAGAAGGVGGAGELYRHTGGAGGGATKAAGSNGSNNCMATGGGAVGLFGTGFAGGAGDLDGRAASNQQQAAGGGGVNGAGGATSDTTDITYGGSTFGPSSAGGGALAPGFGFTNNIGNVAPSADAWESTIDFWNGGSLLERVNHTFTQTMSAVSPPGTGGLGRNGTNFTVSYCTGASLFAGGAGIAVINYNFPNDYRYMIGGRLGGGGGAGGIISHSGRTVYSGAGGHGGVLIEMLERIT